MATSFNKVYKFFLSQISEYSFLKYTNEELETILFDYLEVAIGEFENCKVDLSQRDDVAGTFDNDLSDKESLILAKLMVVAFFKPKVLTAENYQQVLTDNEFKIYSQANHIDKLFNVYDKMQKEAQREMTSYSFRKFNMDDLKNGHE